MNARRKHVQQPQQGIIVQNLATAGNLLVQKQWQVSTTQATVAQATAVRPQHAPRHDLDSSTPHQLAMRTTVLRRSAQMRLPDFFCRAMAHALTRHAREPDRASTTRATAAQATVVR